MAGPTLRPRRLSVADESELARRLVERDEKSTQAAPIQPALSSSAILPGLNI